MWFSGIKGAIYEIYAQDLSEYGYFIQHALFDQNIAIIKDNGQPLIGNNFLAFTCPKDGYYLIRADLASSYPPEGVEYIISVIAPESGWVAGLLLKVKNPPQKEAKGLRADLNIYCKGIRIRDNFQSIPPDIQAYLIGFLEAYEDTRIDIYQRDTRDLNNTESFLYSANITLERNTTKGLFIDLTGLIDPNLIKVSEDYYEKIEYISPPSGYPWDVNNPIPMPSQPYGFMDSNYPPDGDYDGDGMSNYEELITHDSSISLFCPTIPLMLHEGINLFYIPDTTVISRINHLEVTGIDPDTGTQYTYYYETDFYYYDANTWHYETHSLLTPYVFNAIQIESYSIQGVHPSGILYIDLMASEKPPLSLKGFLTKGEVMARHLNTIDCLPEVLFDPNCFAYAFKEGCLSRERATEGLSLQGYTCRASLADLSAQEGYPSRARQADTPSLYILTMEGMGGIGMITGSRGDLGLSGGRQIFPSDTGEWESVYRFFEREAGDPLPISPFEPVIVYRRED